MGIDRIGKNGPPVPVHEIGGASRAARAGEAFQVPTVAAAPAAREVTLEAPRGALDRLRAGEADVGGYVDLKVDEATSHLSSLSPVEMEAIRSALRDHLAHDPALAELVRTAAGEAPPLDD